MNQCLAVLLLSLASTLTEAAPITLNVNGNWETLAPDQNISVTATFDNLATDQDPLDRIGAYSLTSVTFAFTHLSQFTSPFSVRADVTQSTMHIYPTAPGVPTGEVRLFGRFDQTLPFPNGILPTEFDFRITLASLQNDQLTSLFGNGALPHASLYMSDQLGARSSNCAFH